MLLSTDLWVGFSVVGSVLIPGLAQTIVSFRGDSLIPGLGGNRPVMVEQEGDHSEAGTAAVRRE